MRIVKVIYKTDLVSTLLGFFYIYEPTTVIHDKLVCIAVCSSVMSMAETNVKFKCSNMYFEW